MLDDRAIAAASALLVEHWETGRRLPQLPPAMKPTSRAEGYAVQALLEAHSGAPVRGWKIAATSIGGQRHINVEGPLAGRLLAERVYEAGATVPLAGNAMRVAEPEFCFSMARDLPPRAEPYGLEEVVAAAGALHLAIELPDSRFDDVTTAGAAQLIADDACAHLFVLGPAAAGDWRRLDLAAHRVVGRVTGKLEREGSGAEVLGDPRLALAWLANELSGLGVTLKAGQIVTTGTCMAPLAIEAGDTVTADFGALGSVSVTIGE